jgi:hypothetical protein
MYFACFPQQHPLSAMSSVEEVEAAIEEEGNKSECLPVLYLLIWQVSAVASWQLPGRYKIGWVEEGATKLYPPSSFYVRFEDHRNLLKHKYTNVSILRPMLKSVQENL